MEGVIGVILGGGRGTRLFPLTLERAKPSVSFAGKYRLIDIPISNCINSGIKQIFVLTQFMSASLHQHIMRTYQFDKFTNGFVDILAAEQTPQRADWFQGTADAVRATLIHTSYYQFKQMLILSGDHLYRMDYRDLISFHRNSSADITLCVYPVPLSEAGRMGLLRVDDLGMVEEFVEKPSEKQVINRFRAPERFFKSHGLPFGADYYLASMGIYVFQADALLETLSNPDLTDFGREVIPWALGRYRVMVYPFTGYWKDIGTIATFFETNIALTQPEPPFELYRHGWPLYTKARYLPPSLVIKSDINHSLFGEGCDIVGASISDSIIGMRSIIRKGSSMSRVVMMGADFYDDEQVLMSRAKAAKDVPPLGIGRNCFIEQAIIDKNVRIGDGVIIQAKPEDKEIHGEIYWVRDGITIIPKGTIIPPGTKV